MAARAARAVGPGPTPTPRNLKLLRGRSPGRDSGGRPVEPEVPFTRGPLVKPGHLSADAAWLWDRVVEQMETIGLLKPLDAPALESACEVFARWRWAVRERNEKGLTARTSQGLGVAPWIRVEAEAARDFRMWCAEFGLTPAAEKNVKGGDGNDGLPENPFE